MHLVIEIIGDVSPDADRLMKALRETVAFWGRTNTEQYSRAGAIERTAINITPMAEDDDGKAECQS